MYKYEYEKVKYKVNGWKILRGNIYIIENYKTLINKRAKDGWRFVGYIPVKLGGHGDFEEIELIFEKSENCE